MIETKPNYFPRGGWDTHHHIFDRKFSVERPSHLQTNIETTTTYFSISFLKSNKCFPIINVLANKSRQNNNNKSDLQNTNNPLAKQYTTFGPKYKT